MNLLQNLTIVLIGCGQMGSAILRGLARDTSHPSTAAPLLRMCDHDRERAEALALELGGEMIDLEQVSKNQEERDALVFKISSSSVH